MYCATEIPEHFVSDNMNNYYWNTIGASPQSLKLLQWEPEYKGVGPVDYNGLGLTHGMFLLTFSF